MSADDKFFLQFIDEYFAECDEHLATSRRVLMALETAPPTGPADPLLLRDLFRSLHTLKGLAGMVGDANSEKLAHGIESALRETQESGAPFAHAFVDAMFSALNTLDRGIAAHGSSEPTADPAPVLASLSAAVATRSSQPNLTLPSAAVSATPGDGKGGAVQSFEFTPSAALSARGVSVDVIRARLGLLGNILDAKPRLSDTGLIFDFRVSVAAGGVPDAAWLDDGMTWSTPPIVNAPEPVEDIVVSAEADAASTRGSGGSSSMVRVDLARVDDLMRLVGDLVISRSRLDGVLGQLSGPGTGAVREALEEANTLIERQLRRLREAVMRIRLVPVGEVFERLRFAARDAIRESGKQVNIVFHGQTTEIDKLVVDRMLEPLLHLVRNAVSHGIEASDVRFAQGKPAVGTLTLRAAAAGDRIVLDVEDDGRGIDMESVARRARADGLLGADERLTDDKLVDVLSTPGFSTRGEADRTSGRGIGMDVVRSTVRTLGGDLSLHTTLGKGTRFVIELPLTLMIVDALLVDVGGQEMAVPQPSLREILQVETSSIVQFENNDVVSYRDGVLSVVRLARLFGLPERRQERVILLVVGNDAAPMGFLVDRLIELREIVVHPVTDPLVTVPGVSGATERGDGRVSLILDTVELIRLAQEDREQRARARFSPTSHTRSGRSSRDSRASS
ncbi:MAG: chemotaxis protein CheA [Gemmatimonadaceae bacterium]